MNEATFLSALHELPDDEVTWLALADWLEEDGQSERAELIRVVRQLSEVPLTQRNKIRAPLEVRLHEILAHGVLPPVPELVNSIGMRLALIPTGRFRMGSPAREKGRFADELSHEAEITRPYYLGVFPVTQGQFRAVTNKNPSMYCATGSGKDAVAGLAHDDLPVDSVTWTEANQFCERLASRDGEARAKRNYRLPTEAEWEHACRAGTTTAFHVGKEITSLQANINETHTAGDSTTQALQRPTVVGLYRPNAFGLYDMHGNVWEWCLDRYQDKHYQDKSRSTTDPEGPSSGTSRVLRGGAWAARAGQARSARRHSCSPRDRIYAFGFRVVMTVS